MTENADASLLDSESVFIKIHDESPSKSPNYTDSIDELQDDLKSLSWDQLITLDLEESSQITPTNGNMYEKVKLTKHEAFKLLNMAATLLQRNIRRYFQQKKYRNFLIAYKAAVKIQSAWRGYRTRNLDTKVTGIKHDYMMRKLQEQMSTMNENYKKKLDAANRDKSLLIQIVSVLSKELEQIKNLLNNLDTVKQKSEGNNELTTPKNRSEFYVNNPHLIKSDSGINVNMNSCDKQEEISSLSNEFNSHIVKESENSSRLHDKDGDSVIQAEAVLCVLPANISVNKANDSVISSTITKGQDMDNVTCTKPEVSFHPDEVDSAFSSAHIAIYDDMSLSGRNTSSPTVPSRIPIEKNVVTTSDRLVHSPVRCTTPTNIFTNSSQSNKHVNESKTSNSVSSSVAVEEYIENLLDHVIQNPINPALKLEISNEMNGHIGHISNHVPDNNTIHTYLSEGSNEFSNVSFSLPRKEDTYVPCSVTTAIQCETPTNISLNNTLVSSSVVEDEDESNHFNLIGGIVTVNDMSCDEYGKTCTVNAHGIYEPGTFIDEFMQADSVEFMNDSLQDCQDSLQMDSLTLNPMEADSLQFMHDSLQVD